MVITTPEFGGTWGQTPHEKSLVLNVPSINNTDAYKVALQSKIGFHVVEVINNEVISAATDPTQNNVQVLLHCRVDATGQLTFTMKSASPQSLVDLEQRHLHAFT